MRQPARQRNLGRANSTGVRLNAPHLRTSSGASVHGPVLVAVIGVETDFISLPFRRVASRSLPSPAFQARSWVARIRAAMSRETSHCHALPPPTSRNQSAARRLRFRYGQRSVTGSSISPPTRLAGCYRGFFSDDGCQWATSASSPGKRASRSSLRSRLRRSSPYCRCRMTPASRNALK